MNLGAGLGELDIEAGPALSDATDDGFLAALVRALLDDMGLSSCREPSVGTALIDTLGDAPRGEAPRGEAANVGALKGCIEKELRRVVALGLLLAVGCVGGVCRVVLCGLGGSLPSSLAALSADMGLVPGLIPAW